MTIAERTNQDAPAGICLPTVLLVDDDLEALGALRRALRNEPYDMIFTDDPFQALEWIKSRDIHLVITDEFMPAMLGTELLEAVRQTSSGTGMVLLTGYLNPAVTYRGFQQRVDLMLAKPWNDGELRETARRILKERARSPSGEPHPDGGMEETPPDGAD
jgi:DNA-binding NtrC family response regulator